MDDIEYKRELGFSADWSDLNQIIQFVSFAECPILFVYSGITRFVKNNFHMFVSERVATITTACTN
jgi:hypothetical protein